MKDALAHQEQCSADARERHAPVLLRDTELGCAKVSNTHSAVCPYQDILWLKIPAQVHKRMYGGVAFLCWPDWQHGMCEW